MNLQVYKFLKSEAEADKNKALASIELLTNHPAGIGDHSTKDIWNILIQVMVLEKDWPTQHLRLPILDTLLEGWLMLHRIQ